MTLGAFSVSLAVKNIEDSFAFYQKLGFTQVGGDVSQKWIILRNDSSIIGLFEGMFEHNILTFNPGWDMDSNNLDEFDDVRTIEKQLLKEGIDILRKTEQKEGPEHIVLQDPDGNVIMLDQHR